LCALFPYASIGVIYVLIKGYFPAAFPWEIFSALLYMAELWLIALIAVLLLLKTVPTGFLPNEDQGYLMADVQLPEAA
jgi:multidrug efflux pump subunit AcrB